MSDSTTSPNTSGDRPTDGSAVFTHPETSYLQENLTRLDRLVLNELIAGGKRFTITEEEVVNLFL